MQNIAVLLAGGMGKRFGGNTPKQMLLLKGVPILRHTIQAFIKSKKFDRIVVVCHPHIIHAVTDMVADICIPSLDIIQGGGYSRCDSTYKAVQFLQPICDDMDKIIVHDGVRPMVTGRIINDCIHALDPYDAITVGVPSIDSVMRVQGGVIESVPNRADYMRMQTPQGFRFHIIHAAYMAYAPSTDGQYTDDCGVVMAKCPIVKIGIVLGDENNIKITTPKDIKIAENIAKSIDL